MNPDTRESITDSVIFLFLAVFTVGMTMLALSGIWFLVPIILNGGCK